MITAKTDWFSHRVPFLILSFSEKCLMKFNGCSMADGWWRILSSMRRLILRVSDIPSQQQIKGLIVMMKASEKTIHDVEQCQYGANLWWQQGQTQFHRANDGHKPEQMINGRVQCIGSRIQLLCTQRLCHLMLLNSYNWGIYFPRFVQLTGHCSGWGKYSYAGLAQKMTSLCHSTSIQFSIIH